MNCRTGRLFGFFLGGIVKFMSRLSFSVTLKKGVQIPVFPVIFASFYSNLEGFFRTNSIGNKVRPVILTLNALLFAFLYQAESAFINLVLIHIGFSMRVLSFFYRRGYFKEMGSAGPGNPDVFLFHNYVGSRTAILFAIVRSIVRNENGVLFADDQVFRILTEFKRKLSKGRPVNDPEGKAVLSHELFGMWTGRPDNTGEQVVLNCTSPWNMISACKYLKKGYRLMIIPETKIETGHLTDVRMMNSILKVPEGAMRLAGISESAVSVFSEGKFLFLPGKIMLEKCGRMRERDPRDAYRLLMRKQMRKILLRPYRFVPFLHAQMWPASGGNVSQDALVKMKWKRKTLLFYAGGRIGMIDA